MCKYIIYYFIDMSPFFLRIRIPYNDRMLKDMIVEEMLEVLKWRKYMASEHDKKSAAGHKGGESVSHEQHQKAGHASHESGKGHEFDSREAREAGKKGGHASHHKSSSSS
ncbi:hypothetical protein KDAU_43370 [Dictyobacter aurantiacus]|uniref:Stress-induced protein n=2 Tax=Dictyobacter aurantiacus TaxID=1936993 RepID=A0A401ZJK9_9CHLR|nr:hypothetical protein KDAU_43370 [Dictyobacter aurantiacus]